MWVFVAELEVGDSFSRVGKNGGDLSFGFSKSSVKEFKFRGNVAQFRFFVIESFQSTSRFFTQRSRFLRQDELRVALNKERRTILMKRVY